MARVPDDGGPATATAVTPTAEPGARDEAAGAPAPRAPDDAAPDDAASAEAAAADAAAAAAGERRAGALVEFVAVLLLSVTTILTAWSAFEASKWGGAMSIAFSQASSSRIEASRADETGNARTSNQVGLWTQWAVAEGAGNDELAAFLEERFPEPLATAHRDWLAAGGATGGPDSPFAMPSYVLPEKEEAAALDARADERFATALVNNQRSDNYTILTVLFATVLFFTAMSGRVNVRRSQWVLLGVALALGAVGVVFLATFPKLV